MSNNKNYKSLDKYKNNYVYKWLGHVLIYVITLVLITTGLRTISLINTLQYEREVKEEVMVKSYIELVKSKNEAQSFASPQSIMHQARDIFSIQKSNELRVVIVNQYEVDKYYSILLANIQKKQKEIISNDVVLSTNQWQIWWNVLWKGVYGGGFDE